MCVLLKEHLHYGVAVHKFLSRSSDCQELLTRSVERRVDRPA